MDVKGIIRKKGYTIEQVAELIGVTRITLTQNLGRNPTINTLQRIADAIGCKVGDFFLDEIKVEYNSGNKIVCPHCKKEIEFEIKIK